MDDAMACAATPPEGGPEEQLKRVLVATALSAQFVALTNSNPTAAVTASLLAWTLKVVLEARP